MGKSMSDANSDWNSASPVTHVSPNSPPVFLYDGEWDTVVEVEQMGFMERALRAKNIPVETYTVKFLGHIATYVLASGAERRGIQFSLEQIAKESEI
jgi:dipeptidyl aminopeptidase/acylaminoacyl peptidase